MAFAPSGCKQPTPPPQQTVQLAADYIGAKEVWLRVTPTQQRGVRVMRDGVTIFTNNSLLGETLVVDSNLVPSRSYTYTATPLKDGRDVDEPSRLQVTTLDTTSHAVSWQIDTLGAQGLIRDVWAFAENNIWAVGEIQLRDSSGQLVWPIYNAARWDGVKWNLQRVTVNFRGNLITPELHGIFAFSPNQIWLAASGSVIFGDGSTWTLHDVRLITGLDGLSFTKCWGKNLSSVYFIGRGGSVVFYNGTVWRKMESGTTVDLEDVWGIDPENGTGEKHVWAAGMNISDGRSVVLEFNGREWKTIYDNFGILTPDSYYFSSIWTDRTSYLFTVGASRARLYHSLSGFKQMHPPQQYVAYSIRGTSAADLFVSGQNSEVLHYGGETWHLYEQVQVVTQGARWLSLDVKPDLVVAGGWGLTELSTSVPIVLRGYR